MNPRVPVVVVISVLLEVLLASAFLALSDVLGAIVALLFGLVIVSLGSFALMVYKVADAASPCFDTFMPSRVVQASTSIPPQRPPGLVEVHRGRPPFFFH